MKGIDKIVISVGGRIKEVRKSKAWTLGVLSEKTKISVAMLSKIENGRIFPSFYSLLEILLALEVDLNEFFSDLESNDEFPGYILKRKEEQTKIDKEEDSFGFDYNLVLKHAFKNLSIEVSILSLDSKAKREALSTDGYEFLYVLNGEINFQLGEQFIKMKKGDSLFFDGTIAHVPECLNSKEAELLIIYFISSENVK